MAGKKFEKQKLDRKDYEKEEKKDQHQQKICCWCCYCCSGFGRRHNQDYYWKGSPVQQSLNN